MTKKMKECFEPHALMHNLLGIGLGIVLVVLVPAFGRIWFGLAAIAVAVVWEMTR